jgi:hypothetical protein
VKDCGRTYVGQTKNISLRLKEHNKGWGAMGTAEPQYRPYAVAAYIFGMPHIDKRGRESLEQRWKKFILESKSRGEINVFTWVLLGERVVESYNAYQVDEKSTFDWSLQLANPRCKCFIYYCPTLEVKVFH